MGRRTWTKAQIETLKAFYSTHGLAATAEQLGKTKPAVREMASIIGLRLQKGSEFWNGFQQRAAKSKIGKKRPDQAIVMRELHAKGKLRQTTEQRKATGRAFSHWLKDNDHPKGMLGKHHSAQTRELFSRQRLGRKLHLTSAMRANRSAKASINIQRRLQTKGSVYSRSTQGWFLIRTNKYYFRSTWEVNYARYLEWCLINKQIKNWEYEPQTFWFENIKRGVRSYLPDFRITNNDGAIQYHEVKGWMDKKSATKIARMKKYYPDVELVVIDKVAYKSVLQFERMFPPAVRIELP